MDKKAKIEDTRKAFEASFAEGAFYNRQTQDAGHLEKLLKAVRVSDGMRILDLGCGSGYLTFPLAKRHPTCDVIGLDIVSDALRDNRCRAKAEAITNLTFITYDGVDFPVESGTLDWVVTRYALHHFPDIEHSIQDIHRCLKRGGRLLIADPCPNPCDTGRFVDDYMRLKKDGHVRFYTKDEWMDICGRHGLRFAEGFETTIRFPKQKETAIGWENVLKKHDKRVIESYHPVETETALYLTERVNNLIFEKE